MSEGRTESFPLVDGVDGPRIARRCVERLLSGEDASFIADAVTMTSELATNALTHGGSPRSFEAAFLPARGDLFVLVTDGSTAMPSIVPSERRGPAGGLGMAIVAALSSNWGCERAEGGKRVWFRLGRSERAR